MRFLHVVPFTAAALTVALTGVASAQAPSQRIPLTNAPRFVSLPAANQTVNFGVHLALRNENELEAMVEAQSDPTSPMFRHWLEPAQFRAAFGPTPATVAMIVSSLRTSGFAITHVDSQLLHVRGSVASVERAFHVHLGNVRGTDGRLRLASREQLRVPEAIASAGATVVSLGYRTLPVPQSHPVPQNRYSATGGYWFDDLKQAYTYPAYPQLTGAGMTIATVGYSDFNDADAAAYFAHERLGSGPTALAPAPVPQHLVFGDSQAFSPKSGTSFEADLDVQQAGGSAPGATILGIAAPATDAEGFLYAYSYIVDNNNADIVSTSYGDCELFYTPAYNGGTSYVDVLKSYHEMFLQGNSQGITFIFSSGDDSGRSCPQVGYITQPGQGASYQDVAGTSIWSDDPNATSVGGTNLTTVPNPNPTASPLAITSSAYVSEQAQTDQVVSPIDPYGVGNYITNALWGSGGGPSVIFQAPAYQKNANTGSSMRVSPDVSMHMGGCPAYVNAVTGNPATVDCSASDSFDVEIFGGQHVGVIGTSASAPEFAGLLAVKEQMLGGTRLGNANVSIYKLAASEATNDAFHQGIPANNGVVTIPKGQTGYNPVIGVGTPIGLNFLGLPKGLAAGNPQTASNP